MGVPMDTQNNRGEEYLNAIKRYLIFSCTQNKIQQ